MSINQKKGIPHNLRMSCLILFFIFIFLQQMTFSLQCIAKELIVFMKDICPLFKRQT
uniref:Uncharacterized protein n=1 Tax=Anguilla anguilla TaxID=7936 RepID=A0A0E9WVX6_ANGAN